MTDTEQRDRRRMESYRKIIAPGSGSAENEVAQAREKLAALDAKYPQPKAGPIPHPDTWTRNPFTNGFDYGWRANYEDLFSGAPRQSKEDADRQRAERDKAERTWQEQKRQRDNEEIIRKQRKQVEAIPFWGMSDTLRELYAKDDPWSERDHVFMNRAHSANREGKRDRDAVAKTIQLLGHAWADAGLSRDETEWIRMELGNIAASGMNQVSNLALMWLGRRGSRK